MGRGQQSGQISPNGIKGNKPHIQQAGIAHDDIEPQRQHDVEQGEIDHADPVVTAKLAGNDRSNQQCDAEQGHT